MAQLNIEIGLVLKQIEGVHFTQIITINKFVLLLIYDITDITASVAWDAHSSGAPDLTSLLGICDVRLAIDLIEFYCICVTTIL